MKTFLKSIRRHSDLFLINGLGLLIAGIIYCGSNHNSDLFLGTLATAISLSLGYRSYKIEDHKIFKELFESFNNKYDEKFNDKLNGLESELTNELIADYLNFCAEEYLWYKKKRIDEDVWTAWKAGMEFHFKKSKIRKIIDEELKSPDSYYGLFDTINLIPNN
ncbi:MAG: hypothetical protein IPI65_00115 [Bacteroidetes bacterium]|nr:hypothetical protein [Bacteroidota bacterium]